MDESVREELTETPPPILYRYLDLSGAAKTMASRTINFTPFDQLDDIWEALPSCLEDGTREEQHEMLRQALISDPDGRSFFNSHFHTSYSVDEWKQGLASDSIDIDQMIDNGMIRGLEKSLFDFQHDVSQAHAICSFSEDPVIELMWALYAQHHSGICLGFSIPKQWELMQVEYSNDPVPFPFLIGHQDAETLRKAMRIVKTKRCCWSFQQEWRVVLTQCRLRRDGRILLASFSPESLVKIVLGPRFPANESAFCRFFHLQFPNAEFSRIAIRPKDRTLERQAITFPDCYTDASNEAETICSQIYNLDSYLARNGLSSEDTQGLFSDVSRRIKCELNKFPSEGGKRLLAHCQTDRNDATMLCAAALIVSYSKQGTQFFYPAEHTDAKGFEEIADLFLTQKLSEVVATLPISLASIDNADIDRRFISHVFSLTRIT